MQLHMHRQQQLQRPGLWRRRCWARQVLWDAEELSDSL